MKTDGGFDTRDGFVVAVAFAHHDSLQPERVGNIAICVLPDNDFDLPHIFPCPKSTICMALLHALAHAKVKVMKYAVALIPTEEGYSVSCPGLPGCWSQGATEEEALANIREAIREYQEVAKELAGELNLREVEVPA